MQVENARAAADTPSTATSKMHLDLSSIPPLMQPSPPSNTLLITQLTNPAIFQAETLSSIRELLQQHTGDQIYTFSPLKSMRRIVVSFHSTEAAISTRRILDGQGIMGCRARVYFGVETTVKTAEEMYLQAPDKGRLFFISPPPSPPLGWTMRNEDPPNKAVHADDLASALAKLRSGGGSAFGGGGCGQDDGGVAAADMMDEEADISGMEMARRRAASGAGPNAKVVYHPDDHGGHANLPAVLVEDVGGDEAKLEGEKRILTHTARPPVELMLDEDEDHDMDMS